MHFEFQINAAEIDQCILQQSHSLLLLCATPAHLHLGQAASSAWTEAQAWS
jgi:hypothetical protein